MMDVFFHLHPATQVAIVVVGGPVIAWFGYLTFLFFERRL